jgi:hypothetical protein
MEFFGCFRPESGKMRPPGSGFRGLISPKIGAVRRPLKVCQNVKARHGHLAALAVLRAVSAVEHAELPPPCGGRQERGVAQEKVRPKSIRILASRECAVWYPLPNPFPNPPPQGPTRGRERSCVCGSREVLLARKLRPSNIRGEIDDLVEQHAARLQHLFDLVGRIRDRAGRRVDAEFGVLRRLVVVADAREGFE